MNNEVKIFADGGARGNPGPAGVGVVIYDDKGKIILEEKKFIGHATNNQAEYNGLIFALELAKKLKAKKVKIMLDSELVVNQLLGKYRVKNESLKPLFQKVLSLTNNFEKISFFHTKRDGNKLADKLVNCAIDEKR